MNTLHRGGTSAAPMRSSSSTSDPSRTQRPVTVHLGDVRFDSPLNPKLFAEIADRVAQEIAPANSNDKKNQSSQLRRFYDEFVMWQEKVGTSEERFQQYLPFLMMLKAKVAYAKGRGHVDQNFEAFLRHLLDQCTNAEQLRLGKLFFEAFMAFYKVYSK